MVFQIRAQAGAKVRAGVLVRCLYLVVLRDEKEKNASDPPRTWAAMKGETGLCMLDPMPFLSGGLLVAGKVCSIVFRVLVP